MPASETSHSECLRVRGVEEEEAILEAEVEEERHREAGATIRLVQVKEGLWGRVQACGAIWSTYGAAADNCVLINPDA